MIKKILFILSISVGYYSVANAQVLTKEELDHSVIYFLKNSGEFVSVRDSADFIRIISPPDSSDLSAYVVRDFYMTGKPKLIGKTLVPRFYLKPQGAFIEYFPNGHRKTIQNYKNGGPTGEVTHYYPNGKLYYASSFDIINKRLIVSEAGDSTGKATVSNGNGTLTLYDNDFKFETDHGSIVKGLMDGEWTGIYLDSINYVCLFKEGKGTNGKSYLPSGKVYEFSEAEMEPLPKGGMGEFYKFLAKNIHYPAVAKENNIQGEVFLTFIVERDGKLNDIKILRGIGAGCDEEALRVLKLSPPWSPGFHYGIPVRVKYQVPISFALQVEYH
ncbi:MAG: TonB family protein [Mucilaginibacter sp.]